MKLDSTRSRTCRPGKRAGVRNLQMKIVLWTVHCSQHPTTESDFFSSTYVRCTCCYCKQYGTEYIIRVQDAFSNNAILVTTTHQSFCLSVSGPGKAGGGGGPQCPQCTSSQLTGGCRCCCLRPAACRPALPPPCCCAAPHPTVIKEGTGVGARALPHKKNRGQHRRHMGGPAVFVNLAGRAHTLTLHSLSCTHTLLLPLSKHHHHSASVVSAYFSFRAATPGRTLPSSSSREAPPGTEGGGGGLVRWLLGC